MKYLIVDNNQLIVEDLTQDILSIDPGAKCHVFTDPRKALEAANRIPPDRF